MGEIAYSLHDSGRWDVDGYIERSLRDSGLWNAERMMFDD
jgi:hypothetical protein